MSNSRKDKPELIYISKGNITHLLIKHKNGILYSNKIEDRSKIVNCVLGQCRDFRNSIIIYLLILLAFMLVDIYLEELSEEFSICLFLIGFYLTSKILLNIRLLSQWLEAKQFLNFFEEEIIEDESKKRTRQLPLETFFYLILPSYLLLYIRSRINPT